MARMRRPKVMKLSPAAEKQLALLEAADMKDSVILRVKLQGLGQELLACVKGGEFDGYGTYVDLRRWRGMEEMWDEVANLVHNIDVRRKSMNELRYGQKS